MMCGISCRGDRCCKDIIGNHARGEQPAQQDEVGEEVKLRTGSRGRGGSWWHGAA